MPRYNKSQFAILGFLSLRPMSVYEIKQCVKKSIAYFWTEGEGQLYPTLKSLTESKLVTYKEETALKSGTKKIYTMTQKGKEVFLDWLKKKADRPVYRNELLLKLFFGSNQSPAANIKLLAATQDEYQKILNELYFVKNSIAANAAEIPTERLPYIEVSLNYGIETLAAELKWCDSSIKKLKKLKK